MQARDCNSNDSRCDLWGTAVLQCNKPPRIVGTIDDSAIERLVVVHFPFTFTSDADKLRSDPAKYKPIDDSLKGAAFMKEHYCALVQLLLDECPDGTLFIAPWKHPVTAPHDRLWSSQQVPVKQRQLPHARAGALRPVPQRAPKRHARPGLPREGQLVPP